MHAEVRAELMRLMETQNEPGWGPNPYVCRWCGCWLRYSDSSSGKPKEDHALACFAVKHLGRPTTGAR